MLRMLRNQNLAQAVLKPLGRLATSARPWTLQPTYEVLALADVAISQAGSEPT